MFRPRRFSRPRRLTPPTALWVYFTPLPRPGFHFPGVFPPEQPHGLSPAVSLLALMPSSCRETSSRRQSPTRTFRALLHSRVRCDARLFRPRTTRSPLKFSPSSGSSPHTLQAVPRVLHPRPFEAHGVLGVCDLPHSEEYDYPVQGFRPSRHRAEALLCERPAVTARRSCGPPGTACPLRRFEAPTRRPGRCHHRLGCLSWGCTRFRVLYAVSHQAVGLPRSALTFSVSASPPRL